MSTATATQPRTAHATAPGAPEAVPRRRANTRALRQLREPFEPGQLSTRPEISCRNCEAADRDPGAECSLHDSVLCHECGQIMTTAHDHIEYVSHTDVVDRYLEVDPQWNWRPAAWTAEGLPLIDERGGLWMWVMVGGVERLCYGGSDGLSGTAAVNASISNGWRNSGKPFGVPTGGPGKGAAARPVGASSEQINTVLNRVAEERGAHTRDHARKVLSDILGRPVFSARALTAAQAEQVLAHLDDELAVDGQPGDTAELDPQAPAADPTVQQHAPADAPAPQTEPAPPAAVPKDTRSPQKAPATPPAVDEASSPEPPADRAKPPTTPATQARILDALFTTRGIAKTDAAGRLEFASNVLERTVASLDHLSRRDADKIIHFMNTGEAPQPAADPDTPDAFTVIESQIQQAASADDAHAIANTIAKALAANQITKSDAKLLHEKLRARGRKAGTP